MKPELTISLEVNQVAWTHKRRPVCRKVKLNYCFEGDIQDSEASLWLENPPKSQNIAKWHVSRVLKLVGRDAAIFENFRKSRSNWISDEVPRRFSVVLGPQKAVFPMPVFEDSRGTSECIFGGPMEQGRREQNITERARTLWNVVERSRKC